MVIPLLRKWKRTRLPQHAYASLGGSIGRMWTLIAQRAWSRSNRGIWWMQKLWWTMKQSSASLTILMHCSLSEYRNSPTSNPSPSSFLQIMAQTGATTMFLPKSVLSASKENIIASQKKPSHSSTSRQQIQPITQKSILLIPSRTQTIFEE